MKRVSQPIAAITLVPASMLAVPESVNAQTQTSKLAQAAQAPDALTAQCNKLAEFARDPNRQTAGVERSAIDVSAPFKACKKAVDAHPKDSSLLYQLGRAYQADNDNASASTITLRQQNKPRNSQEPQWTF